MAKVKSKKSKLVPDFSKCRDPEFARIHLEALQLGLEIAKNNPFLRFMNAKSK